MIIIGILIGLAAAGLIVLFVNYIQDSKPTDTLLSETFQSNKQKVKESLEKDYQNLINDISAEYRAKKNNYESQIKTLDKKISQAEKERDDRIKQIKEEVVQCVDKASRDRANALAEIQEYYSKLEVQQQNDFEHFKNDIAWQRKELQEKIKKESIKYDEMIEQLKRQEQIKQDRDFYRITLTSSQIEDVQKLKCIAAELHDPSILYKLIYKTYYERPFNEMVGRVITGRGDTGIYKITSLTNGRVYIGQTRQTFKERWRTHVKRGLRAEPTTNNKLYAAMWEEGIENFTFEVLSECTAAELNEKEKDYIKLYKADSWGYNSTGGNS